MTTVWRPDLKRIRAEIDGKACSHFDVGRGGRMTTVWRPDLKRIRAEIDGKSCSHFDVGRSGMTRRQLRANVEEICGISRWSEDDKWRCHTERWETVTDKLAGKDDKMSEDQCDRYHTHFDAKEFLTAIMRDRKVRKRFNADMIKAIEVTFASTVAYSKAAKLPKGESIAMLAHSNFTAIYEVANRWLQNYGRNEITSPFATAAAWERLKKIDEKKPRIVFNRSKCVKDYLSANQATATYYASFFQAVEDELPGVVFIDQAENIMPCARHPGMPYHCIQTTRGGRWLANQFSLRWVKEAEKRYGLEVVAYSVNTTNEHMANGLRDAVGKPGDEIVEFPHYYYVSMSEEDMIELARLKLKIAMGKTVNKARLKKLKVKLEKLRKGDGLSRRCEHGRQRSTCKVCGGVSICEHSRQRYQCKECGGSGICQHARVRSKCKECGGGSICEHNRQRSQCKECGGGSICAHGRQRSTCKECGGCGICQHGRQRHRCKECGGASICEHDRQRSQCKECGGASVCGHGRQRSKCKECGGSQICEHGRQRSQCKECGGAGICEHGRRRTRCKECGGGSICEHNRRRNQCKECGRGAYCEHRRIRYYCKECGGKGICEHGRHRHRCNECDFVAATMRSQCKVLTGQQSGGAVIGAKRARMQNGWTVTKITSWISTATEDTERRERSFSHVDARLGLGPG